MDDSQKQQQTVSVAVSAATVRSPVSRILMRLDGYTPTAAEKDTIRLATRQVVIWGLGGIALGGFGGSRWNIYRNFKCCKWRFCWNNYFK